MPPIKKELLDSAQIVTKKRVRMTPETFNKMFLPSDGMCPYNRQANDAVSLGVLDHHDYFPQPE